MSISYQLVYFKLINGDEIVAQLISTQDGVFNIKSPMKLHYIHKDELQFHKIGIILSEWIFQISKKDEYDLHDSKIIIHTEVNDIMEEIYYKTLETVSTRNYKHAIKEGYASSDKELVEAVKDFIADDEEEEDWSDNSDFDIEPTPKKGIH